MRVRVRLRHGGVRASTSTAEASRVMIMIMIVMVMVTLALPSWPAPSTADVGPPQLAPHGVHTRNEAGQSGANHCRRAQVHAFTIEIIIIVLLLNVVLAHAEADGAPPLAGHGKRF